MIKRLIIIAGAALLLASVYTTCAQEGYGSYPEPTRGSFVGTDLYLTNSPVTPFNGARAGITRIDVYGTFAASTSSWIKVNTGSGEYFLANPGTAPTNTLTYADGAASFSWKYLDVIHIFVSSTATATNFYEVKSVLRQ